MGYTPPDNTAPVAITVAGGTPDNTAPAAITIPGSTPSNTPPEAITVPGGVPDNTAPGSITIPGVVPDNAAPGAITVPGAVPDNTAAVPVPFPGLPNPLAAMPAHFVPAFTGAAALVALPTVGLTVGCVLQGIIAGSLAAVQLTAGDPAHDATAGIFVPADHDDTTNNVYWAIVAGSPA